MLRTLLVAAVAAAALACGAAASAAPAHPTAPGTPALQQMDHCSTPIQPTYPYDVGIYRTHALVELGTCYRLAAEQQVSANVVNSSGAVVSTLQFASCKKPFVRHDGKACESVDGKSIVPNSRVEHVQLSDPGRYDIAFTSVEAINAKGVAYKITQGYQSHIRAFYGTKLRLKYVRRANTKVKLTARAMRYDPLTTSFVRYPGVPVNFVYDATINGGGGFHNKYEIVAKRTTNANGIARAVVTHKKFGKYDESVHLPREGNYDLSSLYLTGDGPSPGH